MNRRLLMLNGLAILAVVANHASHSGFIAMFWWTDRYQAVSVPNYDQMGSLSYFLLIAMQKLALFSVPTFLFITGIFLAYTARGAQTHLTWKVVLRRILNLLPPYLLWTTVFIVVQFVLGEPVTPVYVLASVFLVDYSIFFFIPLVIFYYLISPFLSPLAKNRPLLLLGLGGLVLFMGIAKSYLELYTHMPGVTESTAVSGVIPFLQSGKIFEYFFYYAAGLVAGFHQAKLKEFVARAKWPLLAAVIVMAVLAVAEAEWVFQATELDTWRSRTLSLPTALFASTFILTFLAFDQVKLPFSGLLYQLGVDTLGIYLVHKSVLLVLPKIVYHVLPVILGLQPIYQSVLIAIAVGIPLVLMMIMRQSPIRSHYRTVFG